MKYRLEDLPVNQCFQHYHLDANQTIHGEEWDDDVVGPAIMEVEIDD